MADTLASSFRPSFSFARTLAFGLIFTLPLSFGAGTGFLSSRLNRALTICALGDRDSSLRAVRIGLHCNGFLATIRPLNRCSPFLSAICFIDACHPFLGTVRLVYTCCTVFVTIGLIHCCNSFLGAVGFVDTGRSFLGTVRLINSGGPVFIAITLINTYSANFVTVGAIYARHTGRIGTLRITNCKVVSAYRSVNCNSPATVPDAGIIKCQANTDADGYMTAVTR